MFINQIDIGIFVGDHHQIQFFVTTDGGDTHIREAVDLVQDMEAVVFFIVGEQLKIGSGKNGGAEHVNSDDILVRHVSTPMADSDPFLGKEVGAQGQNDKQHEEFQMTVHCDWCF